MRMLDVDKFSEVVEAIYDCALNPDDWRNTLPLIAQLMNSPASAIAIRDMSRSDGQRYYDCGIPEPAVESYFETYSKLDPFAPLIPLRTIGEPGTLRTLVPQEEYRESRFYKEWAQPNRQGDLMGFLALRSGPRLATHAVCRLDEQPDFGAEDIHRYKLIVPHICRALAISDALDLQTVKAEMLAATLDGLAIGVVLVADDLKVVHLNCAADRLMGKAVTTQSGRLTPSDAAAMAALAAALRSVASRAWLASGIASIALPGPQGDELIATVLPLGDGAARRLRQQHTAIAAVFLQSPRVAVPIPGEAFAKLYNITPSELRIAIALSTGLQAQEVAVAYGVSLATVKTHLARLFNKTGTSRQADLVVLMLRAGAPTRSGG